MRVKARLYAILEKADEGDSVSKAVDVFLVTLIMLNVVVVIVETVQWVHASTAFELHVFEVFSVAVFTIEYLLRLWICTLNEKYSHPIKGRLAYATSAMALIDLVAIMPFYLPFIVTFDLRIMRLIRLVRLLRLLKVFRYSESIQIFADVYRLKRQELSMVFLAIIFLLTISSAVVYHLEHEAQPDDFSSIPSSMWWGVATLTTVGYGDVTPITAFGRFFGAIIALLGVGLVALPAGILGSGFIAIMRRKEGGVFQVPSLPEGDRPRGRVTSPSENPADPRRRSPSRRARKARRRQEMAPSSNGLPSTRRWLSRRNAQA